VPKAKWICFRERTYSNDIHSVLSSHVETVTRLSKRVREYAYIDVNTSDIKDDKSFEKPTYKNIKEYILNKYGVKAHTLYIAQIKKECGLPMRE